VAHAFNYGVALAKNDLVLMLGSDDRLMPHAVQACQWAWDHYHDPLGYYYFIIEYESGRLQDIPCNGAFVHKELWKRTGGFPVEAAMGACDTWLISLLYASKGRAGNLYQISPTPLYWYRDHPQTDTVQRGAWMGMIVTARNIWVEKQLMNAAHEQYRYWLEHWSDVQTHLPTLYEHARGNVLELGVRAGVSTSALLAGVSDHGGHVWSVDINDCSPVFGNHPLWTFIQADSLSPLVRQAITADALDCLFIDTAHTAEQTIAELRLWGPMVAKGGVILLHDTDDGSTYPGVRDAMAQYCQEFGLIPEFHEGSYGLGVIRC
jgi:cephalosporin hydroxylase